MLLCLLGRRELSTLEPFDLILLVVIGDLVQQGVTQSDMSFTGLLRAERLTFEEVAAAARPLSIASLDEVEWAIVEGGGPERGGRASSPPP